MRDQYVGDSTASQVTSTGGRELSTVPTDARRKSNIAGLDRECRNQFSAIKRPS